MLLKLKGFTLDIKPRTIGYVLLAVLALTGTLSNLTPLLHAAGSWLPFLR